ncbi:sugar phosphate isomerase/epimerase [candidate division WOR-3 bacterium]|nr:sugar phosphate isomerase/epimerase [candidate division WOR-3 bacterium]
MIRACSTTLVKNVPLEESLKYFEGVFPFIELRIQEGHFLVDDIKRIKYLKQKLNKKRIKAVSLHQPMRIKDNIIDISSMDEWERLYSLREIEKAVIAAQILKIDRLIVHSSAKINEEERYKREEKLKESLIELIEFADKYGIKLYLENLSMYKLGDSIVWLDKLRNEFNNKFEICFDTGHWLIGKQNPLDINKYNHYHIHDNNGIFDEHLFPHDGIFPWDKLEFSNGATVVYELMPSEVPGKEIGRIKDNKL